MKKRENKVKTIIKISSLIIICFVILIFFQYTGLTVKKELTTILFSPSSWERINGFNYTLKATCNNDKECDRVSFLVRKSKYGLTGDKIENSPREAFDIWQDVCSVEEETEGWTEKNTYENGWYCNFDPSTLTPGFYDFKATGYIFKYKDNVAIGAEWAESNIASNVEITTLSEERLADLRYSINMAFRGVKQLKI